MKNKKELGQNWLKDRHILEEISAYADISNKDNIVEIGPGLGTLTSVLLKEAGLVISVEYDTNLAKKLPKQFPGKNLIVVNDDFLNFKADDDRLPDEYKIVANIPYYITTKIIEKIISFRVKPKIAVLLVQEEVAQRIAAVDGKMSVLAIGVQVFSYATVGPIIPASFFTPVPKVNSQVLVLKPRSKPLIEEEYLDNFFRIVKAGFSEKRKKIKTSLSHSLSMSRDNVESILSNIDIDSNARAETLSIQDWKKIELSIFYHDSKRSTEDISK